MVCGTSEIHFLLLLKARNEQNHIYNDDAQSKYVSPKYFDIAQYLLRLPFTTSQINKRHDKDGEPVNYFVAPCHCK